MNKQSKKKYNEEIYTRLNIENLMLVGICFVSRKGDICTFERLVAECFSQFPKVFAFKRYTNWPDSLKFDRPLRKLREKGLIVGSTRDHFSLTEFGNLKAVKTEKILKKVSMQDQKRRKVSVGRSTNDRLITYLKASSTFKNFLHNQNRFSISEPEFRSLLRCTLETPIRVLKQNLEYYKKLAQYYNEKQLLDLLLLCEKQFIKGR